MNCIYEYVRVNEIVKYPTEAKGRKPEDRKAVFTVRIPHKYSYG